MIEFFDVIPIADVLAMVERFAPVGTETVSVDQAFGRVLAETVSADIDLPGFARATMDGYAVAAQSTFGASEANPAYLALAGEIRMGERPAVTIGPGQAVRIATGGMLPAGADAVVMVEHTDAVDDTTIEVHLSVAPGRNMVRADEDFARGAAVLAPGKRIRSAEAGLLAAVGRTEVRVFRRPEVAILSTGDEIVPPDRVPAPGQVRDVNRYSLSALVAEAGGIARPMGIVEDRFESLRDRCLEALSADMVMISGGSSLGVRDFTVDALNALPGAQLLVHGIAIRPGKPTHLARSGRIPVWGLPGHVDSAMVVFHAVVRPFLDRISGRNPEDCRRFPVTAVLSRNLASAQGRADYIRVRLTSVDGRLTAEPLPGPSGLLNTMVHADGLVCIDTHTEGLDEGSPVAVFPLSE